MEIHEFENKVFHCDNLELLRKLPDECIKLTYCDILYGTGNNFGDYQDIMADRKTIEDFYAPRIEQMHRTLESVGSIYLQVGLQISHWIRCIMDGIFGAENRLNTIVWHYFTSGGSRKTMKRWARQHDEILFYRKTMNLNRSFNYQYMPYRMQPSKGGEHLFNPKGKFADDVWEIPYISSQSEERTGYPTQKPVRIPEKIIKASSNEGDLVADFFCGSGTTGVVCINLNRNYLLCDVSEKAIDITNQRLIKPQKRKDERVF